MHKIFGEKENNVEYLDRVGAYLIPYQDNKIGVVKTPIGYFLIGGGMENGENLIDCINRECREETGFSCCIEGEVCSGESYFKHPTIGYFHPIQTFYYGKLLEKECPPLEKDHTLYWIEYDKLRGTLISKLQNWALEQFLEYINKQ